MFRFVYQLARWVENCTAVVSGLFFPEMCKKAGCRLVWVAAEQRLVLTGVMALSCTSERNEAGRMPRRVGVQLESRYAESDGRDGADIVL